MASERSPASAMDVDAERSLPSPPGSKKRPSRTGGDGQSRPNPSPGVSPASRTDLKRRKLRTSAESAALALASVATHAFAASVDADADRAAAKRRGPAGVRVDEGHGAIQMLGAVAACVDRDHAAAQKEGPVAKGSAIGQKHGTAYVSRGAAQKHWSDADEFTLLNAALEFRKRTGRVPRLPDMAEFFKSITDSISPEINQWMVYYKLKRLKSKFQHTDRQTLRPPPARLVRQPVGLHPRIRHIGRRDGLRRAASCPGCSRHDAGGRRGARRVLEHECAGSERGAAGEGPVAAREKTGQIDGKQVEAAA
jgi:hypothetical protein